MSLKQAPSDDLVISKIYTIRGQKVMLDSDLAELYDVPTKALKQQVKRNIESFPEDFMFELTREEFENLRSQIVTSSHGGVRYVPMAFTEHGVLMLSSVLKSAQARQVNIQIMRQFVRMRELYSNHKELMLELEKIRSKTSHNSRDIKVIFIHLKKMEKDDHDRRLLAQIAASKQRPTVGFKTGKDKPKN